MKWSDGTIYKGRWKKNEMNGHGVMTYPNGKVYKGRWVNGAVQEGG